MSKPARLKDLEFRHKRHIRNYLNLENRVFRINRELDATLKALNMKIERVEGLEVAVEMDKKLDTTKYEPLKKLLGLTEEDQKDIYEKAMKRSEELVHGIDKIHEIDKVSLEEKYPIGSWVSISRFTTNPVKIVKWDVNGYFTTIIQGTSPAYLPGHCIMHAVEKKEEWVKVEGSENEVGK